VPASDTRSSLLERLNPVRTAHAMYRQPSQAPRWIEGTIKAYCINRWRDVPSPDTRFTVTFPDSSDRLPKLVACLEEHKDSDHRLRQLAVWMLSDNLLDMTPQQFEQRVYDEIFRKLSAKVQQMSAADLAAFVKEANPSVSEEILRAIRNLSGAELAREREGLLDEARQEARKDAQADVSSYARTETLLRSCGIDVTNSAFFRR